MHPRGGLESIWDAIMATALDRETEDGYLSCLLNGLLLVIIGLGALGELVWQLQAGQFTSSDPLPIVAIALLIVFLVANKLGYFRAAVIYTILVMVLAVYGYFLLGDRSDLSTGVLTYLVLPILIAAFFMSSRAYAVTVPLILSGMLAFMQTTNVFDMLVFLAIFATLLGVFKHNYRQLEEIRKWKLVESHQDLVAAYDATIAGWSAAMDLRDKETEGHSQRVADLTLELAKLLGVNEEEQIQIYRGALLHDIGKLGIPDQILHKPGPLTDSEWVIMRQHPTFALNMLSPISYLQPALDIPYSHHERWNGSGYPRGLKGKQIPLAARIFAVVDVWDALTSERPYRGAWTKHQAQHFIADQAGKLFDPQVVQRFLALLKQTLEESSNKSHFQAMVPKYVTAPLAEIQLKD